MHLHLSSLEAELSGQAHRLAAAVAEQLGAHGWLPAAVDTETRPSGLVSRGGLSTRPWPRPRQTTRHGRRWPVFWGPHSDQSSSFRLTAGPVPALTGHPLL
jgi:hypothetical protein